MKQSLFLQPCHSACAQHIGFAGGRVRLKYSGANPLIELRISAREASQR